MPNFGLSLQSSTNYTTSIAQPWGVSTGTGIDLVQVWASPTSGGTATFVGTATYGLPHLDIGVLLGSPSGSPLWNVLDTLLPLGGSFVGVDAFCAPYVHTRFPRDLPSSEYDVVTRADAPVFARPAIGASIVTSISFEIIATESLPAPERFQQSGWVIVHLANGQSGYMQRSDVRSLLD